MLELVSLTRRANPELLGQASTMARSKAAEFLLDQRKVRVYYLLEREDGDHGMTQWCTTASTDEHVSRLRKWESTLQ